MKQINAAVGRLLKSQAYQDAAKGDPKLRIYAARHSKGELKTGGAVDLLIRFGYQVEITDPPVKKKGK